MTRRVVFDIETLGADFDSLDPKFQDYLLKFSEDENDKEEAKQKLALYPLTGSVVSIGMINPETNKGVCYFQNNSGAKEEFEENGVLYKSGSEKEILENFWENIVHYDQFVTFNGRGFDCPYLMLRSAIVGVACRRDLNGYRYATDKHVDLLDQLTFYGATRKFKLEYYCQAFGIKNPKEEGDGLMVPELYRSGKYLDIARYCIRDVKATTELWQKWHEFIAAAGKT